MRAPKNERDLTNPAGSGSATSGLGGRSNRGNALLIALAVIVIVVYLVARHLSSGHSLVAQTYGNNVEGTTQILGCSQSNGVVNISGQTTGDGDQVWLTLYALSGTEKYANRRSVDLGYVDSVGQQWNLGVADSGQAWGCGVLTYAPPPPP